jgi:alkylation response protein AidB-like acyl-CoA dehydrogenase
VEPASKKTADRFIAWLRDYAGARINSRLIDERRSIPPQIVLDFGNHGLFGLRAPKHYGGCELSYCDSARVLQQLGGIDLTLATLVSSHALGLYAIQKYGRSALRDQLLAQLASGRELSAFAMTEPQAGSHPLAMKTQARATASGDWILSGEKYLIDSGSWASTIVVFARTAEKSNSSVNLSAFAIRQGTPGLSIGGELLTMGLRGMVQNVLTLRDVRVDADSLLGAAGAGLAISQDALSVGRLNLAAKCVGGMKRCLQLMHRFAGRRSVATGMLFDNPVTQSRTVELACAVSVVESLVAKISRALDKDEPVPVEAFLAA